MPMCKKHSKMGYHIPHPYSQYGMVCGCTCCPYRTAIPACAVTTCTCMCSGGEAMPFLFVCLCVCLFVNKISSSKIAKMLEFLFNANNLIGMFLYLIQVQAVCF